ncbi:MAG TPA: ABC transporter ATP-binding protein [Acidimicrobiia bacterium]|nr:ABC transporter ATP-binding protein [Acidimicrobiia bacterium]
MSDTATLSAAGVSVRFGGVTAVSGVSIDAHAGEVLGLIGPNGAGKTTLFDVLSGIRTPSSGHIYLEGSDITRRSPTWRSRHGIRRTFQRQQMFGWLTVEDNVLVALEWRGGGGGLLADLAGLPSRRRHERERRARTDEVLELCGLLELRNQPAGKLPIGRARMVEMARAIVDEPKVLLLDEPTSGLEESETRSLGESMQRVCKERGCAVILVEHDVGFVMSHCDRIVVLNLGSVIAEGTPDAIRENAVVQEAYLG